MVNMYKLGTRAKNVLHQSKVEALLDEYCYQTQEKLAQSLEVSQAAISKSFKTIYSKARNLGAI